MINNFNAGGLSALEAFQHRARPSSVASSRAARARVSPTGEYLGATMYAGVSAEIEFPIPVMPETYGIRGAIWADAAWVSGVPSFQAPRALSIRCSVDNTLKASVGASVIWDGPFGPLRGDVAYVLSKATLDRTQVFQLSIQNLL